MNNFRIISTSADKGISIIPLSADYFLSNFIGEKMDETRWIPPQFQIIKKSYPVRDFICLMLGAPIFTKNG